MEESKPPKWIDYELLCEDVPEDYHKLFQETFKSDVTYIGMVSTNIISIN
jgi:hypothetical protein